MFFFMMHDVWFIQMQPKPIQRRISRGRAGRVPPLKFAKHMLYNVNEAVQQTTFTWIIEWLIRDLYVKMNSKDIRSNFWIS